MSRGWVLASVLALSAVTASCNFLTTEDDPRRPPDVFDKVRAIDLLPRFPKPTGTTSTGRRTARRPRPISAPRPATAGPSPASSARSRRRAARASSSTSRTRRSPASSRSCSATFFRLGYLIDPRVQGTVTLASGRPVPRSDLLFVLESALKLCGAALVRDKRGYMVLPSTDAVGTGRVDAAERAEPGFGITVVPLQYVSAATLAKLLDSFAVKPGTVRVDPARNLVLIQGSGADRRNAVETVLSFDADWMRGQSVGIYPVRNSAPEPIITELERIMDSGDGGLSQSLVKLQPIARLNAIMVVTSKPTLLRTAQTWIARLDKSDTTSTGVKVYHVRYGDARQIAVLLNDIFGGGRQGGAIDSPTNQIAPGAGVATSIERRQRRSSRACASRARARSRAARPSDSRLRGGTGGAGAISVGRRGGAADTISSRSGPFGRGASPGTAGGARLPGHRRRRRRRHAVLPDVRITADPVNNTLLIYANQENYRIIEQTLRQLDRPQLQVSIDATIAEITLNENLSYGVQFFLKSSDVGARPDKGSAGAEHAPAARCSAARCPASTSCSAPRPSRASSSMRCAASPT